MAAKQFGFIGAGRMATALARGFVAAGLAQPAQICASDPSAEAAGRFGSETGARTLAGNQQVAEASQVLFLAVKPQQMPAAMSELRGCLSSGQLVISVAAGIPLAMLAEGLGKKPRLMRVMPNTPCLVGQGASAYCPGPGATSDDRALVKQLLESVGRAFELDEKLLDAVTGLSGSGPAFVFVMIEALADGGVRMGLPRQVALELAAQTLLGSAQMVLTSGEHPAALKDQVASPGGTTIAGLQALESGGLRAALMAAVEAATRRSIELGRPQ
ncbi:MAG TPA: pyrroline-5-carboxylate reductase [Pirellulales bacterium]